VTKTKEELRQEARAKLCTLSDCVGRTVTRVHAERRCVIISFGDTHCALEVDKNGDDPCIENPEAGHVRDSYLVGAGIIPADEYRVAEELQMQEWIKGSEDRERAEYERLKEKFDGKP